MEEAIGPRSLLAIEMNKGTLLLIMFIKLPNSSLSIVNAAKPDCLPKKNLLKDGGSVVQSILKKLKENSSLNFKLVRNVACLFFFLILSRRKTYLFPSLESW